MSSRNFLLRYAPDCTFLSRKMKKFFTVGGGHPLSHPPPTGVLVGGLGALTLQNKNQFHTNLLI